MITVKQSDNPSVSANGPGLSMKDEFIPYVEFDSVEFLDANAEAGNQERRVEADTDDRVELSEYLDDNFRGHDGTQGIEVITFKDKKMSIPFNILKGSKKSADTDGFISFKLAEEDSKVKITNNEVKKELNYDDQLSVEIEIESEETVSFYIDFYANDNGEEWADGDNQGELKDVYCGRIKVVFEVPNEWEFTDEQIEEVKAYARINNGNRQSGGGYSSYDHCTDTHKKIALLLLKNPTDLDLGKDQAKDRGAPQNYEKLGESSTGSVRRTLVRTKYTESSKVFTVLDEDGNEVVKNGRPSNTQKELSAFKNSPTQHMMSKIPNSGNYVFFGAVNDDYHSFTIILIKEDENADYLFIDQFGINNFSETGLTNYLISQIYGYSNNFPLKLELYQLRNSKK